MQHPSPATLLDACRSRAIARGFGLFGVVSARRFDRCQPAGRRITDRRPAAETLLLLGHGGSGGWDAMLRDGVTPGQPRPGYHPIDDHSRCVASEIGEILDAQGVGSAVVLPSDRCTLNFLQLGEEAGFGTISPVIGLLLHPRFGPWISLRAAVLVDGCPFGESPWTPSISHEYQPCVGCSRPCVSACPSQAYSVHLQVPQVERCATHRDRGGCATGCDVRRACPVGAEERFSGDEEAFRHTYSLFMLRRAFGLGGWRFVPSFIRRLFG